MDKYKRTKRTDKVETCPYKDRIYHLYYYEHKFPNEIAKILQKEYGYKISARTLLRHFQRNKEKNLQFHRQVSEKFEQVLTTQQDILQRSKEDYFIFLEKHIEILMQLENQITLLKHLQNQDDVNIKKILNEYKVKEEFKDLIKMLNKIRNDRELKITISSLLKDYFLTKHKIFSYLDKFLKELNLLNLLKELTQKYFEMLSDILLDKLSDNDVMDILDRLGKMVDGLITDLLNKYGKISDLKSRINI